MGWSISAPVYSAEAHANPGQELWLKIQWNHCKPGSAQVPLRKSSATTVNDFRSVLLSCASMSPSVLCHVRTEMPGTPAPEIRIGVPFSSPWGGGENREKVRICVSVPERELLCHLFFSLTIYIMNPGCPHISVCAVR